MTPLGEIFSRELFTLILQSFLSLIRVCISWWDWMPVSSCSMVEKFLKSPTTLRFPSSPTPGGYIGIKEFSQFRVYRLLGLDVWFIEEVIFYEDLKSALKMLKSLIPNIYFVFYYLNPVYCIIPFFFATTVIYLDINCTSVDNRFLFAAFS